MAVLAPHPDAAKVADKVLAGTGATAPEHLLAALSDILDVRPHDTLFQIRPQPGEGFGKVTCLEEACLAKKKIIILNDQSDLPDGGKALGIGSLDYFIHHQKESPAHQRSVRARLKASRTAVQGDVKPTSITSSASATSATSSNKHNKEKKRTLIELSDGDEEDVVFLPTKKKPTLPPTQNSNYAIEALPIITQDLRTLTAPVAQSNDDKTTATLPPLDKGKGRAVLEDHTPLASVDDNKPPAGPINFTSNTAIPLVLQTATKRSRLSDNDSDSDSERVGKNGDFSMMDSDDDDLIDLSSIYASKTKKPKTADNTSEIQDSSKAVPKIEAKDVAAAYTAAVLSSASSIQHAKPVVQTSASSIQHAKPVVQSYGGATAYEKFKALQRGVQLSTSGNPGISSTANMGQRQLNNHAMRDVKPAVPSSSSSPAINKGKGPGMDSGYLSSINTFSSSPASKVGSALPTSSAVKAKHAPGSSTSTPSSSTSKYPLPADRIRELQAAEKAITNARYRMGTLQREMRKYGKRTTLYRHANTEYKTLEAKLPALLATVKTIKAEASGPKKPAVQAVPAPVPAPSKPVLTATASSSTAARPPAAAQPALTAADRVYQAACALYQSQCKLYEARKEALTNLCLDFAKSRDTLRQVVDRCTDKRQKKLYLPTLNTAISQLAEAHRQLRVHLSTEPKPPKKEVPPPAPAPSASQYRFGNILTSSDPRFTQLPQPGSQAWAELRKNLLTGYPGQGVDASGRMNAYGDSEASISFLAGRGPNPYSWSASSAAAGPSRSLATGAGHAGHSAVLGPTGLAPTSELYAPVKPYGYSSDDDAGIPLWRRGLEEYSGGDRVYTEAETLSFFKDAAAGYDFNEEGEKALEEALVTIGLEKQGDIFPGTTIQPFAHQILGIAWMLEQESVRTKINGGILADDMGLGKTVQTISLIHLNQAKEGDDEKATLVLAPQALLEQWKTEVTKHTGGRMKAHIYHGSGRRITKDELEKYDIVLTTPNIMSLEWEMCDETALRAAKKAASKDSHTWTKEEEADWYQRTSEQSKPLFTINWRRVVIDEAQYIRNRSTRVSRACCHLNATYRWCLTGTPITNTLTDIYSLLRFLKINPWQDWGKWRDEIFKIEKRYPSKASKKVQAILKLVLLRRNKDSELNGKRLLNLKPMIMNDTPVVLSDDEKNVYEYIEGKSQQQLSKYIREGTVMKNYAHVLILLLRLRQCVGHPALVTESFLSSAYMKAEDAVADRAEAHQLIVKGYGQASLDAMLKRRIDLAKQRFEDEKAQKDVQMEECPICMDPLDASALITPCGHTFCVCIKQWIDLPETAAQNPENFGEEDRACPNCRQKITKKTLFTLQHFEPTKEQLAEITGSEIGDDEAEFENDMAEFLRKKNIEAINKKPKKEGSTRKPRAAKTRAGKKRIIKDSEDEDDFIDDSEETNPVAGYTKKTGAQSDSEAEVDTAESDFDDNSEAEESDDDDIKDFLRSKREGKQVQVVELANDVKEKFKHVEGREFIPSAKMETMLRIIHEAPKDDKLMIISQWTSMMDLVAAYLHEQRVPYLQFRGDMSRKDRDAAVKRFNESKKVKCMLLSLKAGGVGLNMVGGNRAILLDLAWSPAVEGQAFSRLHRLGQTKTVFVNRCIVANSVEDRILTLQEHKKKLADHSLGEGTGEKLKKFGIAELKMLFGMGEQKGHFADTWVHPDHDKSAPKITLPPAGGPSSTGTSHVTASAAS